MAKWAKLGMAMAVVLTVAAAAFWFTGRGDAPGGGDAPARATSAGTANVSREAADGASDADGAASTGSATLPATSGAAGTPASADAGGDEDGPARGETATPAVEATAAPEARATAAEPTATAVATVAAMTPEPSATPAATATPPSPAITPEPTAETTAAPTPKPTPVPTPVPAPTPAAPAAPAPTAGNATAIAALWDEVDGIGPISYEPTYDDFRELRKDNAPAPRFRSVCIAVRPGPLGDSWLPVPDWITTEEFRSVTEVAVAAWNARIDPDPFTPGRVPDCGEGASLASGWIPVGFSSAPARWPSSYSSSYCMARRASAFAAARSPVSARGIAVLRAL